MVGKPEPGGRRAGRFEAVFRSIEELAFTIGPGSVGVRETVSGRDLAGFGLVQVAAFPRPTGTLLNAVAAYLRHHGVPAVNADGVGAPTRLLQYVEFALAGLPVPATRYLPSRLLADSFPDLSDQLELPFVLTALRGSSGDRDFLVRDEAGFTRRLGGLDRGRVMLLAHEFIPYDVTCHFLVLGDQTPVVLQRGGSVAACLSGAGSAGPAELIDPAACDPAARRIAVQAASLMGFDVAGIEVARHWTTGQWYVLDASPSPEISAGRFAADKVRAYTAYLTNKLGG
jgi:glutathione synthase/RimK-type ligase-like ATP-grasp enzyme